MTALHAAVTVLFITVLAISLHVIIITLRD